MAMADRRRPYLLHEDITIIMNEIARAYNAIMQRSSAVSVDSGLLENFNYSTMPIHMVLAHQVTADCSDHLLDTERWFTFMNSAYLM